MLRKFLALWPSAVLLAGCHHEQLAPTPTNGQGQPAKPTIALSSPAFAAGGMMPKQYTCDGQNISPPLKWTNVPKNARSLAVTCEDPDAPQGTWTHWVLFNLPATMGELKENVPPQGTLPNGAGQGMNDFQKIGYGGACPPSGTHRYIFKVYALDAKLSLAPGCFKSQVVQAMQGHAVGVGQLVGKYAR